MLRTLSRMTGDAARRLPSAAVWTSLALLTLDVAAAQSPAPAPTGQPPVKIGVAAAVQGPVEVASAGAVGQVVQSGKPIFLGDVVTTGAGGRLQILLLDETVFTIGPGSSIVIDEFVYDPATHNGQLAAEVLKGAFRFVTGQIARKRPEQMKVKLPSGTIGVRGTMVQGRVSGEQCLVVLLGPGPENSAGARIGRIEVSNQVGDTRHSVMVTRPGYGTTIERRGAPPSPPLPVPPDVMGALNQELAEPEPSPHAAAGEGDTSNAGSAAPEGAFGEERGEGEPGTVSHPAGPLPEGEDAGPPTPEMLHEMAAAGYITEEQLAEMLTDLEAWNTGDEATRAALMDKYSSHEAYEMPTDFDSFMAMMALQGFDYDTAFAMYQQYLEASNTSAQDAADTSASVSDGIATRNQLAQVETGQFHYSGSGAFTQTLKNGTTGGGPYAGTMNVLLNIDFGARTIGGGGSTLSVNTTANGGNINSAMAIGSQSFSAGGTDLAVFSQTSNALTGQFTIKNSGGVTGATMDASASYNDGLNQGSGTITDASRSSGLQ